MKCEFISLSILILFALLPFEILIKLGGICQEFNLVGSLDKFTLTSSSSFCHMPKQFWHQTSLWMILVFTKMWTPKPTATMANWRVGATRTGKQLERWMEKVKRENSVFFIFKNRRIASNGYYCKIINFKCIEIISFKNWYQTS